MITPTQFGTFTDNFHETGDHVHAWVLARARRHFADDARYKAEVTDRVSVERYREQRRHTYLAIVGPLADAPAGGPRAETTDVLEREGYSIRKLILRGRSGLYVTANAYFPTAHSETPRPGVLMVCGHAADGKAAPHYQRVCIDLVRAGMIVLIIDSPSHGEMVQCLDAHTGAPLVGLNTEEHSYLQLAASVLGRNIMREFINNARAGLDWLAAQPEVDAARLGVTGNSGGGHLTQALMMTDDRLQAAVSCCSQTTREHYLANGVRAFDGEQNYYGCIPAGLDYDDFFAAFAPRPLRIGAAAHDFFAIEGVLEAVERARRIYRVFDAEEQIDVCLAADEHHGYTAPLRRGCVEWFTRHLLGLAITPSDEDPPVETPETLLCTRSGQVMLDYPDGRSVLDLLRTEWQAVRHRTATAPPPTRLAMRRRLNLPPEIPAPNHVRRTVRHGQDGMTADRLFFFSEPGIIVTGVIYTPPTPVTQVILLLIPDGTEGQALYAGRIDSWLRHGRVVMVFDPRGTGAVRMRRRNIGQGLAFRSTEFRIANDHFMLGTSIAAQRTYDVLRACAYLRNRPDSPPRKPVAIEAHGWPAIYGLLAAAIDESVVAGALTGLPDSWGGLFEAEPRDPERYSEPLIVPELGGDIDIPDLLALAHRSSSPEPGPCQPRV